MTTEASPKAGKSKTTLIVALCVGLLVGYALSSGPAVYLGERGFVSLQVVRKAYAPLLAVAKYSGGYYRYTSWWVEKAHHN